MQQDSLLSATMWMFADAYISRLGYLSWNLNRGERRSLRLLDRVRLALHARFALAFAFLKNAKEKACFARYGNNFSRFQILLSIRFGSAVSNAPPPLAFERLALSSRNRLLARRISERSDDRKYVFVCRMVVCITELLIYRPFQFYSEKNFEFTCKRRYHSASENSKKLFQLTESKFATETS